MTKRTHAPLNLLLCITMLALHNKTCASELREESSLEESSREESPLKESPLRLRYQDLKRMESRVLIQLLKDGFKRPGLASVTPFISTRTRLGCMASELAQRQMASPLVEGIVLAQQIDQAELTDEALGLITSALLTDEQRYTVLSQLTQPLITGKKLLAVALSPTQVSMVLSFEVEGKGLCEQWGIPILRKKAIRQFEEPISALSFTDGGDMLLRSRTKAWFSGGSLKHTIELTNTEVQSVCKGITHDSETVEIAAFFENYAAVRSSLSPLDRTTFIPLQSAASDCPDYFLISLLRGRKVLTLDTLGKLAIESLPLVHRETDSFDSPNHLPQIRQNNNFRESTTQLKKKSPSMSEVSSQSRREREKKIPTVIDAVVTSSGLVAVLSSNEFSLWSCVDSSPHLVKTWDVHNYSDDATAIQGLCINGSAASALFASRSGALVFDCAQDDIRTNFELQQKPIRARFHPDRILAALVLHPATVCIVNTESGQQLFEITPKIPFKLPLENFAFSNDGSFIVLSDAEGHIELCHGTNKNIGHYLSTLSCEQALFMRSIAHSLKNGTDYRKTLALPAIRDVINSLDRTMVAALFSEESIQTRNADGWLPLHEAAREGDIEALEKALEQLYDIDCPGVEGDTALMCAAERSSLAVMTTLLKHGASLYSQNDKGLTVAHAAVRSNNPAVVRFLLDNDFSLTEEMKIQLLHYSAEMHKQKILEWLLDLGVPVDARDSRKQTTLHSATARNNPAAVVQLITRGAEVNAQDSFGDTPLLRAVKNDLRDLCDYYLSTGARIDVVNNAGETAFDVAFARYNTGIIKALVSAQMRLRGCAGEGDLLHFAAFNGRTQLVRYLLQQGHYECMTDIDNNTPLHLACAQEAQDVIQELLTAIKKRLDTFTVHQVTPDIYKPVNIRNKSGVSPFHLAMKLKSLALAQEMLALGATVDGLTRKDETPLHFAAFYGNSACVALLLDKGADPCAVTTEQKTPLHLAIERGHHAIARLLLSRGALVNGFEGCVQTPLHNAAFQGDGEAVQLLLEAGANPAALAYEKTPACLAAQGGFLEIVELLLERILKNVGEANNWTIFHLAVDFGYYDCVKLLLEGGGKKGWDANNATARGETPLHIASSAGYDKCVELLIVWEADLEKQDPSGRTALHRAVLEGHTDVVRILCRAGANLQARDDEDFTPLNLAIKTDFYEGVETLIINEIEARAECEEDFQNWTLLDCARFLQHEAACDYLEKYDVGNDSEEHL